MINSFLNYLEVRLHLDVIQHMCSTRQPHTEVQPANKYLKHGTKSACSECYISICIYYGIGNTWH